MNCGCENENEGCGGWLYLDMNSIVSESSNRNNEGEEEEEVKYFSISDTEFLKNTAAYGTEAYFALTDTSILSKEMIIVEDRYVDEGSFLVGSEESPEEAENYFDIVNPVKETNRKSQSSNNTSNHSVVLIVLLSVSAGALIIGCACFWLCKWRHIVNYIHGYRLLKMDEEAENEDETNNALEFEDPIDTALRALARADGAESSKMKHHEEIVFPDPMIVMQLTTSGIIQPVIKPNNVEMYKLNDDEDSEDENECDFDEDADRKAKADLIRPTG